MDNCRKNDVIILLSSNSHLICFTVCYVTELKKKDREREIQEKKIKELQEMRLKQEQEANKDTGTQVLVLVN